MAGKLSDEQRQEIVRRYEAGEKPSLLAEQFGIDRTWVPKIVRTLGGQVRGMREWRALEHGSPCVDIAKISPARWLELYQSLGSGYPSCQELSRRFGVADTTIRRYLVAAGIKPRSAGEQQSIDIKMGRRRNMWRNHRGAGRWTAGSFPEKRGPLPLRVRRKISATKQAVSPKVTFHCPWCGEMVTRVRHKNRHPRVFCSRSHAQHMRWHDSKKGMDAPRPLILVRLKEILWERHLALKRNPPFKDLPRTLETLEEAGLAIGAGEAEYFCDEMIAWVRGG